MKKTLEDSNYIILHDFISKDKASKLSFEFTKYCKENNIDGDEQAPNSFSTYNYTPFLELLCEKTPEVSKAIGETVLPTYSYARIYKNGSVLKKHIDRDACEISLTLHLHGDRSWPIWIETPSGQEVEVVLNPGEAMVYLGKKAPHWREEYGGEYYTQVFLHYVRSRGDCGYAYFDKQREDTKPIEEEKEVEKKPVENTVPTYTSKKCLEDYIFTLDNVVPEELCDAILNEYCHSDDWVPSTTGTGLNPDIRNCDVINISEGVVIERNLKLRQELDERFYECASKAINEYRKLFPEVASESDTGYNLLRYNTGQFYVQHTDHSKPNRDL